MTHPDRRAVYDEARTRWRPSRSRPCTRHSTSWPRSGEIAALDLGTGTTRFDPNVERPHHHLVCRSCGKVRDLHVDFAGLTVPAGADEGFEVGRGRGRLPGPVRSCRADAVEPDRPSAAAVDGTAASARHRQSQFRAQSIEHHQSSTRQQGGAPCRTEGLQDRREPEGGVRRREPGEPPVPVLRAEGRRRGLPGRRRAVPLGRRG